MRIRTAIFGVYVGASAVGFAVLMAFVLRDVRLRYIEAMRRTMGDTAVFLAVYAAEAPAGDGAWAKRLETLPPKADLLRVFASDRGGKIIFDSANGADVGQVYDWPMRGGGVVASEWYTVPNVAVVGDELRVRAAVRTGGDVVGWVGVGRPIATVREGVSQAQGRLVIAALVVTAVLTIAGWWLAQKLAHSLERLTAHAQAVRDGHSSTPPQSRAKEIRELSEAFEEMRTALEGKAYVERYTQTLAHEIKAPLAAIRGAAELLGEELPSADRDRFLANLRDESARIQRIVDRLLELSALEARHGRLELADLELRAVVEDVLASARSFATARNVTLSLEDGSAVRVAGERSLLTEAVRNLVHNALEFTPPGGRVDVAVTLAPGRALVAVEDTGPGLPEFAVARAGERFFSLPRPDTGRKSTGLGLSIVREIARLHEGDVTLINRAPCGARAELWVKT